MLNARHVIIAALTIACLSILSVTFSYLITPDPGILGSDSYGTRPHGYRALVDLLLDLNIPIRRSLQPPSAAVGESITLAFLAPNAEMVRAEPVYLHQVASWVHAGGRMVIAPKHTDSPCDTGMRRGETGNGYRTVLQEIGLDSIETRAFEISISSQGGGGPDGNHEKAITANPCGPPPEMPDDLPALAYDAVTPRESSATVNLPVSVTGNFEYLRNKVSFLCVFQNRMNVLVDRRDFGEKHHQEYSGQRGFQEKSLGRQEREETQPRRNHPITTGRLYTETSDGTCLTLAASYRYGKGEIVVLGDPALVENRLLASKDNSVLACHLLAMPGYEIVLDEFYHGLFHRGNPLWLLQRPHFQLLTMMILMALGLWAWRNAVRLGPTLPPATVVRRSWGEYMEAMARFMSRSRTSKPFMLKQVRDGVLWYLRRELNLRPGQEGLEEVALALARKQPQAANELRLAVQTVDRQLEQKNIGSDKKIVQSLQAICQKMDF